MGEGGTYDRGNRHHLVAYQIDGILLHGVPATGQHLGRTRYLELVTVHLHRSAHAGAQPLHGLAAHGTHGNGILHQDVVHDADIDVAVHTHFPFVVAGGNFLLCLQLVLVTPVRIVFRG